MNVKVAYIHSSAADFGEDSKEYVHGPADIIVYLTNHEKYIASFFSYAHIQEIQREKSPLQENTNDLYFWNKNMILAKDCKIETVQKVIEHLIEEGDFWSAFEKF